MSNAPTTPPASNDRAYLRHVLITILLVSSVWITWQLVLYAAQVFLLAYLGILLGVFFCRVSGLVSHWTRLPYHVALGLVVFLLVAVSLIGLVVMGAQIANQIEQLATQLQKATATVTEQIRATGWGEWLLDEASQAGNGAVTRGNAWSTIFGIFSTAMGAFLGILIVGFVGFYVATNPRQYRRGILVLLPIHRRARAQEVLEILGEILWRWILGRIAGMLIIGIASMIGLWLLSVPLAMTLGVIAGLLNFIPNIGPTVALIPAVLLALQQGPQVALYVVIFYLALQGVESYIITPLIEQHQVSLPPALLITGEVLLGVLAGVTGVIVAAPLMAAVLVLVQELYIKDVLGDHTVHALPVQEG